MDAGMAVGRWSMDIKRRLWAAFPQAASRRYELRPRADDIVALASREGRRRSGPYAPARPEGNAADVHSRKTAQAERGDPSGAQGSGRRSRDLAPAAWIRRKGQSIYRSRKRIRTSSNSPP